MRKRWEQANVSHAQTLHAIHTRAFVRHCVRRGAVAHGRAAANVMAPHRIADALGVNERGLSSWVMLPEGAAPWSGQLHSAHTRVRHTADPPLS